MAVLVCAGLLLQAKDPESVTVTLDYKDLTIAEILTDLQKVSGVPIEMDESAREAVDPAKQRRSIKVQDINLTSALHLLFRPLGLTVRLVDKKKFLITVQY